MAAIGLRRAYEPPAPGDGYRVLIDRIWPRGRGRAELALDAWRKDLAPSPPLRRWFGHDPARWAELARRYLGELASADPGDLPQRCRAGAVTLVYGAKDERHNHALVLREYLLGQAGLLS